jgi:hypothetical protein
MPMPRTISCGNAIARLRSRIGSRRRPWPLGRPGPRGRPPVAPHGNGISVEEQSALHAPTTSGSADAVGRQVRVRAMPFATLTRGLEAPSNLRRKTRARRAGHDSRGRAGFHRFGCRQNGGVSTDTGIGSEGTPTKFIPFRKVPAYAIMSKLMGQRGCEIPSEAMFFGMTHLILGLINLRTKGNVNGAW